MVEISCICGHRADCSAFISNKIVDRWLCCPSCKIKFSSPHPPIEVGVQIIDKNVRSEHIREPSSAFDRVEIELRIWERDKILKENEQEKQSWLAEIPVFCL